MLILRSKIAVLFLAGILVGFLGVKQIIIGPKVVRTTQAEEGQVLAVETGELYRTNKKFRQDIQVLEDQKTKLSTPSVAVSEEALQQAVTHLEIITGKKPVVGPGVTVSFVQPLQVSDIVDFINALRNIGSDAIAIHNQRVVSSTGFTTPQEASVAVIGDPTILRDALTRKGGILEQINVHYTIDTKDNLELPAVER